MNQIELDRISGETIGSNQEKHTDEDVPQK